MSAAGDPDVSASTLFDGIAAPLLDAILSQAPVGITIASAPNVEILRVSEYGGQLLQRSRVSLESIGVEDHAVAYQVRDPVTRQLATSDRLPLTRATKFGETVKGEEWLVGTEDGQLVPIICNAGPIRGGNGQILGGVVAWMDISPQKELEKQLQAAIAERDAAQLELHHRVKNHLALVAAVVRLEARGRGDDVQEVANTIGLKINALANVYAALEGEPDRAAPAAELLKAVAVPLATPAVDIKVTADADLLIPVDQCAPIGIIVNEAVCNALKHGYPHGRVGLVTVSLTRQADVLELVIANDGLPLSSTGQTEGLGSTFIARLIGQLKGTVMLGNADPVGVVMTARFPPQ